MATWTLRGPAFDSSNEVLRDVRIITSTDRARNTTNYYRVRVGIRDGDYVSYIGTYDQSLNRLGKGVSLRILNDSRVGMRLRDGWKLEVEVRDTGEPADIVGTSVEFVFDKVGSVSGAEKPLVLSQASGGAGHDTTEDATVLINRNRLSERRAQVQLIKPTVSTSGLVSVAQYEDEQTSADTTTAAAFEDGPVSITVLAPANKTTHVSVYAHCTHSSNSGRNVLAIGIGDGTTDHNEARSSAGAASGNEGFVSTRLDTSITADTTFKLRFYRAVGSGTSSTTYNLITATAVTL